MIDLSKPVVENVNETECFYTCKEPRGSLIIGIIAVMVGIIIMPVFVVFIETMPPLTIDTFMVLMFNEFSKVIGYTPVMNVHDYILSFLFSFLGGMACVKPSKSLALPFVVLAISIIGFLFLALFMIGFPVNYEDFVLGLVNNLIPFAIIAILPSLLGSMATRISLSKKSCFVKGDGVAIKK